MTLLRLFLVVTLCGAVMTACGSSGSPDDPNSNQGGGGNAGSPDSAGGTGGNDVDPVGGSGGDIGAGGVGGFGGNVGGEGGSMLPDPAACPEEKSDMPSDSPCTIEGRWEDVQTSGWLEVTVAQTDDHLFTVSLNGDEVLFQGTFEGEALPLQKETEEGYLLELDTDDDGFLIQRVFQNGEPDGESHLRRM